MKSKIERILLLIIVLILWEICSIRVNPLFVPAPKDVFKNLIILTKNGDLFYAIKYSFLRATFASLLSATISIPIGLIVFNVSIASSLIKPLIDTMRFLPITAFYPLLIMWLGIGEEMKIAFLFIATFVYMVPSVVLCLEEVNQDLIDTGLTIGMSNFQTIYKIQLPASLPGILSGFVTMYGIAFTYIPVCEGVNAKHGLGWIIQQSSSRGRTDMVFMAIIVIVIISVLFDSLSKFIIKKIFRWRYIDNDTD